MDPEPAGFARDIGRLEARQDSAEERLGRIEGKVDQILDYVARNKGGIRMLFALSSLAAALGGIIVEAVHWLNK